MPKRMVDGDAIAGSDKLADCRPGYAIHYAYLLTLGLGNGSLEYDARRICELYYGKHSPWMTADQLEAIFTDFERVKAFFRWTTKDGKTWGFFPGIASCGGGIGWGETIQRYFLHPELYERDRDLFKTYIPIIRQLSEAGWEPLTFAQSDNSSILIERFGNWTSQNLLFTLKNNTASTITTNITADAQSLGIQDNELNKVDCQELVSYLPISINVNEPSKQLIFSIDIPSNDVKVISLYASSSEVPFNFWELF